MDPQNTEAPERDIGELYLDSGDLPYIVARMVCEQGLAPAAIARKLFKTLYKSSRGAQALAITKVKRALKHAIVKRILYIKDPPSREFAELSDRLGKKFPLCKFEVAPDDPHSSSPVPIYRRAAGYLADRIHDLIVERGGDVVIGNSGGSTLCHTVQFLQTGAIIEERWKDFPKRPRFLSLNAARSAKGYDRSANFLAVRMAEIYEGEHIAVMGTWPSEIEKEYDEILRGRGIDLVLCGAGAREGFFFRRVSELIARHEEKKRPRKRKRISGDFSDAVVGDIALIPIDARGGKFTFPPDIEKFVNEGLRPRPSYEDLQDLARRGKVVLILAQEVVVSPAGGSAKDLNGAPTSKATVARAILSRGLASTCILGSRLAHSLIEGS